MQPENRESLRPSGRRGSRQPERHARLLEPFLNIAELNDANLGVLAEITGANAAVTPSGLYRPGQYTQLIHLPNTKDICQPVANIVIARLQRTAGSRPDTFVETGDLAFYSLAKSRFDKISASGGDYVSEISDVFPPQRHLTSALVERRRHDLSNVYSSIIDYAVLAVDELASLGTIRQIQGRIALRASLAHYERDVDDMRTMLGTTLMAASDSGLNPNLAPFINPARITNVPE